MTNRDDAVLTVILLQVVVLSQSVNIECLRNSNSVNTVERGYDQLPPFEYIFCSSKECFPCLYPMFYMQTYHTLISQHPQELSDQGVLWFVSRVERTASMQSNRMKYSSKTSNERNTQTFANSVDPAQSLRRTSTSLYSKYSNILIA